MALTIDQLQIQIEAESSNATSAIDNLIGRLETLQGKLNLLGTAGKNAGNGLKETAKGAEKAATATDKHSKSADKASKSTKSFTDRLAQQISKTRTLYGAFKTLADKMAGAFKESNDYIETVNLFNVTMGDAAPAARKYAESVERVMGIDSKDFMQYQGVFKNLTAGFGVAAEDADVMSQNLTQLSYDMASFFNASSVEEAFDKLSSAMSGQVKGLREYGIDTTVATLQEYALSKGIETKVRSMTQAEKAMLRYNYIMEQSTHIQGDMARTLITPANALRVLEAQLTRMKRAFGNIISVLVTQFIPYIQVMVEVVTDAAKKLAEFFGFSEKDFTADTSGIKTSWGDAEEGVDDYSESLKKAKKQMMGFDELNIISNPDSDSGSAGGDASGGLGGMKPIGYDFLAGMDASKTEELKERIKATIGEIAGIIGGAMLVIGAVLTFTGINIPAGIGLMLSGISGVGLAIGWSALENPFNTTLSTLGGIVGGGLLALGGLLAFTGANIPLGIAFLAAGAATLLAAVAVNWDGLNPNVKKTLATISGAVGGALLVLGALLAFTGVAVPLGIGLMAAGAVSIATSAKLSWDSTSNKVSAVVQTIGAVVGGALLALGAILAFSGIGIGLGIGLMVAGAATLFATVAPNWNGLSDQTKKTISIISACVGGALLALGAILLFTGAGIPLGLGLLAAGGLSLASAIAPNWNAIVDKMKSIGKKIGEVWDKVWAGLKNGFKTVLNGLIWYANKMIDGWNFMLTPVRAIIVGIAKAFGGSITLGDVKIPHIPQLAGGGVVDEGQMFIAREAGPELVGSIGRKTAVANNDQIVSGIESGVYRAMVAANSNGNIGSNQTIRIINEIDGDVVGEKVIKYHNSKVMQTGASPLLV